MVLEKEKVMESGDSSAPAYSGYGQSHHDEMSPAPHSSWGRGKNRFVYNYPQHLKRSSSSNGSLDRKRVKLERSSSSASAIDQIWPLKKESGVIKDLTSILYGAIDKANLCEFEVDELYQVGLLRDRPKVVDRSVATKAQGRVITQWLVTEIRGYLKRTDVLVSTKAQMVVLSRILTLVDKQWDYCKLWSKDFDFRVRDRNTKDLFRCLRGFFSEECWVHAWLCNITFDGIQTNLWECIIDGMGLGSSPFFVTVPLKQLLTYAQKHETEKKDHIMTFLRQKNVINWSNALYQNDTLRQSPLLHLYFDLIQCDPAALVTLYGDHPVSPFLHMDLEMDFERIFPGEMNLDVFESFVRFAANALQLKSGRQQKRFMDKFSEYVCMTKTAEGVDPKKDLKARQGAIRTLVETIGECVFDWMVKFLASELCEKNEAMVYSLFDVMPLQDDERKDSSILRRLWQERSGLSTCILSEFDFTSSEDMVNELLDLSRAEKAGSKALERLGTKQERLTLLTSSFCTAPLSFIQLLKRFDDAQKVFMLSGPEEILLVGLKVLFEERQILMNEFDDNQKLELRKFIMNYPQLQSIVLETRQKYPVLMEIMGHDFLWEAIKTAVEEKDPEKLALLTDFMKKENMKNVKEEK